MLRDVWGYDAFRGPQAGPDVTNHDGTDDLHYFPEGIPAAAHCLSNGGVETLSWNGHRRRHLQRYVCGNSDSWLQLVTISAEAAHRCLAQLPMAAVPGHE